jgi:hypothetical protein
MPALKALRIDGTKIGGDVTSLCGGPNPLVNLHYLNLGLLDVYGDVATLAACSELNEVKLVNCPWLWGDAQVRRRH